MMVMMMMMMMMMEIMIGIGYDELMLNGVVLSCLVCRLSSGLEGSREVHQVAPGSECRHTGATQPHQCRWVDESR